MSRGAARGRARANGAASSPPRRGDRDRAPKPDRSPRPTRSDSRQIVEAILGAVLQLGGAASMTAIAARSGVGIASVYRYFPTKASLYAEISRRLHARFLEGLREVLARTDLDLEGTVRAACEVVVTGQDAPPPLRKLLNWDVPPAWTQGSAEPTYRAAMREIRAALARLMSPVPADLDERVFLLFAALRGQVMIAMMFPDQAPDLGRLTDGMTRSALAILRAP